MDIQRLRNLTTGRLHTDITHVYQDLEYITDSEGIMTHMIPNVIRAVEPWLRTKVTDDRFWDGEHDPSHVGDYEIEPMNDREKQEAFERYKNLPSPIAGKPLFLLVTGDEQPE